MIGKFVFACSLVASLGVASQARADVVSALVDPISEVIQPLNAFSVGPIYSSGHKYESENRYSVYGYTGTYGFSSNGEWSSTSMIGTNSPTAKITITFNNLVSGVGAIFNWAPASASNAVFRALDSAGAEIGRIIFSSGSSNLMAPNAFYGFQNDVADIKAITIQGQYIGLKGLQISTAVAPVPGPIAGAGIPALLGLMGLRLWRRKQAVAA